MVSKVIRIGLVVLMVGLIAAVFIWNAFNQSPEDKYEVWNWEMTKGNAEAENHFIEYVDMMCPYCAKFNSAVNSEKERFQSEYLDSNKVLFELRLADMISDHNENSYRGNIAGYCAARQDGKFWDFYDNTQDYLTENYYSKGIGDKKGAPEIERWEDSVYYQIATDSGLDMPEFQSCFDNQETKSALEKNTAKASYAVKSGVPYFVFNDYTSSGFEGSYGTVQQMFRAGGVR